jgi:hypothetical protein
MSISLPHRRPRLLADLIPVGSWAALLAGVLAWPYLTHSADRGDDLTRHTVRLALLYYAVAVALMLQLRPEEWLAAHGRGRVARWCWSLGWATYLVHLGMAFHFYHGWSHRNAIEHIETVSGFGPGIFVSHTYTLVWTLDVFWWWRSPESYGRRPVWVGWLLHGFMAFIIFCATVVYEQGFIRWAGVTMFVGLGLLLARRLHRGTFLLYPVRD